MGMYDDATEVRFGNWVASVWRNGPSWAIWDRRTKLEEVVASDLPRDAAIALALTLNDGDGATEVRFDGWAAVEWQNGQTWAVWDRRTTSHKVVAFDVSKEAAIVLARALNRGTIT